MIKQTIDQGRSPPAAREYPIKFRASARDYMAIEAQAEASRAAAVVGEPAAMSPVAAKPVRGARKR